jgi:hypothetical protein
MRRERALQLGTWTTGWGWDRVREHLASKNLFCSVNEARGSQLGRLVGTR